MKIELYAPSAYSAIDDATRSMLNGCGPGNVRIDFVPDKILGLDISVVCDIHDFMYLTGHTPWDKEVSDRCFLNNLIRLINQSGGILRKPRLCLAAIYYQAVKHFGGPAFWDGKNGEDVYLIGVDTKD